MNPKDIEYTMLVLGRRLTNILYSISFLVHVYSLWFLFARAINKLPRGYMYLTTNVCSLGRVIKVKYYLPRAKYSWLNKWGR